MNFNRCRDALYDSDLKDNGRRTGSDRHCEGAPFQLKLSPNPSYDREPLLRAAPAEGILDEQTLAGGLPASWPQGQSAARRRRRKAQPPPSSYPEGPQTGGGWAAIRACCIVER